MTATPLLDMILQHGGPFGVGLAVGMLMWLLKHQEGMAKDKIIAAKDGTITELHDKFLELHKETLGAMNASTQVNQSVDKAVTAIYAVLTSPIGRKR
jgi:hypothetical protein